MITFVTLAAPSAGSELAHYVFPENGVYEATITVSSDSDVDVDTPAGPVYLSARSTVVLPLGRTDVSVGTTWSTVVLTAGVTGSVTAAFSIQRVK